MPMSSGSKMAWIPSANVKCDAIALKLPCPEQLDCQRQYAPAQLTRSRLDSQATAHIRTNKRSTRIGPKHTTAISSSVSSSVAW